MCELNEHIEILEAALDYKSRSIDFKQPGLRVALESEASYEQSLRGKLEQLTAHDLQDLLLRWVLYIYYALKNVHVACLSVKQIKGRMAL